MAQIIDTSELKPGKLNRQEQRQVYCSLDSCITREVKDAALPMLDETTSIIYDFERALQGPILEIMLRGLLTDPYEVSRLIDIYSKRRERVYSIVQKYAFAIWGQGLNPNSPTQVMKILYETMNIPPFFTYVKGQRKLTANREAMEAAMQYRYARPFARAILVNRDLVKKIGVLRGGVDADGRMRFAINIGGTRTGRVACSKNVFGGGTSGQNITDELRRIFIANDGKKFAYLDLKQAESRATAYISGDEAYIDACESGDVHVRAARMTWPELPWSPNMDPEVDAAIANEMFWRHFTRRDITKRGGHLCLTEDHEVLTPRGWVSIAYKPNVIMAWQEDEKGVQYSSFEAVQRWTDESFSGNLCSFEGNSISALMTPNHRVPFKSEQKARRGRKPPRIRVRRAADGPGTFMPLGNGFIGGGVSAPARLIAAFMSDGWQNKQQAEWHLTKSRKIKRLYKIAAEYGYEINATKGSKYKIREHFPKRAGKFMLHWTKECLEDFVDEYKYWDGYIGPTRVTLSSKDKEHLEWLQTLGRVLGVGGNVRLQSIQKNVKYWVLGQNRRLWASGSSIKFTIVERNSTRVLCPTVRSEFFYVRRNGKIFVTGNTHYLGQPESNAKKLGISREAMTRFQSRYLKAFSGIKRMHGDVARVLHIKAIITTALGRRRLFFGRNYEADVLRQAVAFDPQSTIGDLLNLGMYFVWKYMRDLVELLMQLHDAILIQYDDDPGIEARVIAEASELMTIPISVTDSRYKGAETRTMIVPVEASVGWNWAKYHPETNPDGLMTYDGSDERTRTASLLKRAM